MRLAPENACGSTSASLCAGRQIVCMQESSCSENAFLEKKGPSVQYRILTVSRQNGKQTGVEKARRWAEAIQNGEFRSQNRLLFIWLV